MLGHPRASRRIVVVGGGAAGVVTAAHLLREPGPGESACEPVEVTVVEKAATVGPGLAYGTTEPLHLLNNYAARMSAIDDDSDHLLRWCERTGVPATGATFLPRATYGRYLAELLDDPEAVPGGSAVARVHDEVVGVADLGSHYAVRTASGAVLDADVVVLALGNPPPRPPRWLDVEPARLAADPWDEGLLDRVPERGEVLLVGTGLTMVDVAARIGARRPGVTMTAVSRHGLLPLRHLPEPPLPAPTFSGDPATGRGLRGLLADVRTCLAAGADWRAVVESVKAGAEELWDTLSIEDRERFVRHVGRRWEVARHRMAPPMAERVDALLADGRLRVRQPRDVDPASYDLVVGCTGPAPVGSTGWSPLVDDLAVQGLLWPGPLGLGLDVDPDGALVGEGGEVARGLYAVGAARRGALWEVAAVPDIRRQARRLARHLATATDRTATVA